MRDQAGAGRLIPRGASIAPFLAMEMAREAGRRQEAGEDIVRLDVGQPHFGAPRKALEAAAAAMRAEPLGYSEGLGRASLREAIAADYAKRHGLAVDPARVVVTTGASGAFTLAFLAAFAPGATIAIASPGYPPYRHILSALGFEPALIPGDPAFGLQLTADSLAGAEIAGALVASPANPTGAVLPPTALAALAAEARARGVTLISDEIYHGLSYGAPVASALAFDPDVIVVNSFSKYWAMTGWRVGWIVAPPALVKPIERLAQNLTVAPPTISQAAALGALQAEEECEERKALYAENRSLLLAELPRLGLRPVAPPDGAFYVLVETAAHAVDSFAFCRSLLDAGVAATPGVDFCQARGAEWMRLAYCRPTEEILRGLERLRAVLSP